MTGKMYWLCHARGCLFNKLRDKGFVTLYPAVDDYVFLEAKPENEKWTRKQTELGIHFVRTKGKLAQITEKELDRMKEQARDVMKTGDEVLAVSGVGGGLDGVVKETENEKIQVEFIGLTRNYTVWVDRMDLVPRPREEADDPNTPRRREPVDLCHI